MALRSGSKKEGADFRFGQIVRMSLVMEEDTAFDPIPIGLFSSGTAMFDSDSGADLIYELWLGH